MLEEEFEVKCQKTQVAIKNICLHTVAAFLLQRIWDPWKEIKVLVVGDGGVGKTSMIRRFCKGVFTDDYKKTIGVDFLEKTQFVDSLGEDVRMMVWDTAGQEEFDSITRTYFRGAGAAVLVFSTTNRDSFDAIPRWKSKVEAECGDIAMALVQNKVDLLDQAVMTNEEAEECAKKQGLRFYRSCVKESLNVTEVFVYLAELYERKCADHTPAPVQTIGSVSASNFQSARDGLDEVAADPPQEKAKTVVLTPNKRRTGGKKKLTERFCSLS